MVAFDPLSSAPRALAPAPAIALPLGAAASEPALCWTRRHAPAAGHALLSRLTACVDSLCKGEFTLLQSEMKLALTWPSCSADLRVLWTTLHSS